MAIGHKIPQLALSKAVAPSRTRAVIGYVEIGPMARVGLRWFVRVEEEGEPALVVWTQTAGDAQRILRSVGRASDKRDLTEAGQMRRPDP